jgi:hypothetical protein
LIFDRCDRKVATKEALEPYFEAADELPAFAFGRASKHEIEVSSFTVTCSKDHPRPLTGASIKAHGNSSALRTEVAPAFQSESRASWICDV